MLSTDLALDPSTAWTVGTSDSQTYSLLSINGERSQRSKASVATTNPSVLSLAHTVRSTKGLRSVDNSSVTGQTIMFDRHLIRLDTNVAQTLVLDPEFKVNRSVQLVIEVPRLGASTPTSTNMSDDICRIVTMLRTSSLANLIRVLNSEL
jgi:hypothetical protein